MHRSRCNWWKRSLVGLLFLGWMTPPGFALDIPENTWVQLRPTVELPPGVTGRFDERNLTKMVYVASTGTFLTWDGYLDERYPHTIYSNAIWSYHAATNRLALEKRGHWHNIGDTQYTTVPFPENDTDPTPIDRHPYGFMAYVPDQDAVYIWGGANRTLPPAGRHPEDTWAYHVASRTWTNRHPSAHPSSSLEGAFAYDADAKKLVMFGGDLESAGETWVYDIASNTWTQVAVDGPQPGPRMGHQMVYDPARKRTLLFGGGPWPEGGNELWAFNAATNQWSELTPPVSPPPRKHHGFAYDSVNDVFLVFGGRNRSEGTADHPLIPYADTWVYLPVEGRWQELTTQATPVQNAQATDMDYDPVTQVFVAHFSGAWWAYRYRRPASDPPAAEPVFDIVAHTPDIGGGGYTAVALDAQGYPHVSHTSLHDDADRDSLHYSRWTGTEWESQCVDTTGAFTAIALDRQGRPHITYNNPDWREGRADGGLYYAVLDGSWTIQQLQTGLGWISRDTSIRIDSRGRPHISYYHTRTPDVRIVDNLRYAVFDGGWRFELVKDSNADHDQVGKWNSLVLDDGDNPSIALFDRVGNRDGLTLPDPPPVFQRGLSLAVRQPTGWVNTLIDSVTQTQDNGYGVAMTLDRDGVRRFSYFNADERELKYLREGFGPEIVAKLPWANSERLSRALIKTSIAVSPNDVPFIAFPDFDETGDPATATLRLAYKPGGTWKVLDVATGGMGVFPSMAMTKEGHLVVSYLDYRQRDLRVAFLIDRTIAPAPAQPFGAVEAFRSSGGLACKPGNAARSDDPTPGSNAGGGATPGGNPNPGGASSNGDGMNLAQGFFGCGRVALDDSGRRPRSADAAEMAILLLIPIVLSLRRLLRRPRLIGR